MPTLACGRKRATPEAETHIPVRQDDGRLLCAMLHLLALAFRRPSSSLPSFLPSFRTMERFVSSPALMPDIIVQGILAAFPTLLAYPLESVAIRSAALLGAMAVKSYELTLQIVNDKMVLRTLLNMLTLKDVEVVVVGCHAVVDVATSAQGRTALRDLGAMEKFMGLLSSCAVSAGSSLIPQETQQAFVRQGEHGEHAEVMLFNVLVALDGLIFDDCVHHLETVSPAVRVSAMESLKVIWKRVRNQSYPRSHEEIVPILCKLIVWLAMELEVFNEVDDRHCNLHVPFIGGMDSNFVHFWNDHWECSPFMMREGAFGSATRVKLLGKALYAESGSLLVEEVLTGALACPPFCSDELECSVVFEEIKGKLGHSLILGQDIRLLKSLCTEQQAVTEENYHKIDFGAGNMEEVPVSVDVHTCLDAYHAGYTIALRGMEFRCPCIAAISESLAVYFGQATVGANLYLTPPNAQGLKRHYDDHCVLVWQLSGSKSWKIGCLENHLPRLYSPRGSIQDDHFHEQGVLNILLREGDLLYIPRGFPHEASTKQEGSKQKKILESNCVCSSSGRLKSIGEPGGLSNVMLVSPKDCVFDGSSMENSKVEDCISTSESIQHFVSSRIIKHATDPPCRCIDHWKGCDGNLGIDKAASLHLTFGVEVEPPFDWEGLVHMSLHCWAKRQSWDNVIGNSRSASKVSVDRLAELYTGLLHVAIRHCGDQCSLFRKACLVAAKPQHQQETEDSFSQRQGFHVDSLFKELMVVIAGKADFSITFKMVLTALDASGGHSLDWMRWLRHLPCEDEDSLWKDPGAFFIDRLTEYATNLTLEDMEVLFSRAKASFICEINFAEACELFSSLLQRYRNVRKRFVSGMLALQN